MLSFIVPAYNEELELPATLTAIRHAAASVEQGHEIIVADDASNDRTVEIANEFSARVVAIERRQIAAARNAGGRVARGDVLFFVDADTRISATHVTAALDALNCGCVGGSARIALDTAVPLWARIFFGLFCTFYFGANLGVGAFMFMRRETFTKVGGFDEQYFAGEEMYLTLALKKLGRFTILPEPITTSARKVRMHSGSHVLREWIAMMLGGQRALRKRDKLDLWYDGKRETAAASVR
jgi:cellulose synthase/poly-beta-1,6-N-acetylglucosamine synthase-like glycosyltransferase